MWGFFVCVFYKDSPFFHQVLKSVHEAILLLSTTYTPLAFCPLTEFKYSQPEKHFNSTLVSEALSSHFPDEDIEASGGTSCPRSQLISIGARLEPDSDSQLALFGELSPKPSSYPTCW